ncbi:hypothetical protein HYH03_004474 [Edaphochlamys debaryana]|uniref:SGNH hydrolase-type esterase domain-containing protein n=1 Tax=Edaphochlamys debaryana TaxID=47281 RepID=A0A836C282_9CHLO|nr:hypothetical protein HYH03_004474 [Edaphochlamys debaryana]|eukprot:KAG2497741.1 hypothetical protein HYH03_004474 [Edaphochlamys debaryana]
MTSRLPAVLDEAKKHQVKIDWVVLMGGINDILRYGTSVDEVWGGHEDLYEACKERGVRVLVLTLLEVGPAIPAGGRVPELMQRRAWLNNMIRGAPREHSNVAVLDGGKAFPFPTNASDPRSPLWSDRIHLSSAGYDKLGALVYGALKQHLEK